MAEKGVKQKGELKTARIPIKIVPVDQPLRKPEWIRVKAGNSAGRFGEIKSMLREKKLHTVCEEAACPNIGECFGRGTATFMILGDICTRRCPFCDVGHGQPLPPNPNEPAELADSVSSLKLQQAESAGRVKVLLQSNVKAIAVDSVTLDHKGVALELRNDAVIVCAGGVLPTPFLKEIGILVETKYGTA